MRDSAMPPFTSWSLTALARSRESFLLAAASPELSGWPSSLNVAAGQAFVIATSEPTVQTDSGASRVVPVSKFGLSKMKRFGTVVSVPASHWYRLKLNEPSGTEIFTPPGNCRSIVLTDGTVGATTAVRGALCQLDSHASPARTIAPRIRRGASQLQ